MAKQSHWGRNSWELVSWPDSWKQKEKDTLGLARVCWNLKPTPSDTPLVKRPCIPRDLSQTFHLKRDLVSKNKVESDLRELLKSTYIHTCVCTPTVHIHLPDQKPEWGWNEDSRCPVENFRTITGRIQPQFCHWPTNVVSSSMEKKCGSWCAN